MVFCSVCGSIDGVKFLLTRHTRGGPAVSHVSDEAPHRDRYRW